jgi:hypothetical protein
MTDIDNWLNHLKTDSKNILNSIDSEDAINVLRLMALDTILEFFTNKKMCGRKLSIELNDVSMMFKTAGSMFSDVSEFKSDSFIYTLKAFLYVVEEMINEIKLEIYNDNKKTISDIVKKLNRQYGGSKRVKLCDDFRSKQFDFKFNLDNNNPFDSEAETTESDTESEDDNNPFTDTDMMRKLNKEIKILTDGNGSVDDAYKYFKNLNCAEQMDIINNFKRINTVEDGEPSLIKLLRMKTSLKNKKVLCKKFLDCGGGFGSKDKLKDWIYNAMKLPFGQYKGVDIKKLRKPHKIQKFLNKIDKKMNKAVYGHEEAKESVLQMMSQMIRNPEAKGNVFALYGCPGNGKCFLKNTKILMYNGSIKNVQDIIVGDQIMGDDSKPRNVLSLGNGIDKMYDIISKNEKYTVNSEHILCLKTSGLNSVIKIGNKYKVKYFNPQTYKLEYKTFNNYDDANHHLFNMVSSQEQIVEITVNDYLTLSKHIRNKLKGYKSGVDFIEKKLLFDPYIIGLWLGDGTSAKPEITNQDSTILFYLRNKLKEYKLNLYHRNNYTYYIGCDTKTNTRKKHNTFINILNIYNLINNKHIPDVYKINSRDNRLKLLAGLIDSDGYYNRKMKNYELTLKNKNLSEDIVYLSRSLGYACYIYPTKKSCMYKNVKRTGEYYRLIIYGDNLEDIPVLCPRKKHKKSLRYKNALVNNIEVEFSHIDKYYGFMIDGNQRFLLGNFTVTHNTTLIKEGIAKAMKKPFVFISLGGAQDASFLEGHSFTYEGSIYGRIAQGLMDSGCMDPIFYFDELDKVSNTDRGREIINLLVHLTDPVQNCHFKDKYFYDLDIDLSKATFIFSFNDISNVNYILRDRITCIETKFLNVPQKLHIANKYLLPSILKDIGLNKNDINIDEKYMYKIIDNYTYEGGVRKIKKILYDFCRKLNTFNLTNKNNVSFPYTLDDDMYSLLTKKYNKNMIDYVHQGVNIGMVNGLWANSMGVGGVLPIESALIPTKKPFEIKTTGSLMKVIRESINVAQSVAWSYIDKDTQTSLMREWKKRPVSVHIHCPDGATPKDGPSAGAAMSLTIYSQFTGRAVRGDIAMTGEINLRGEVTKIGGLEEKLTGAKKAGAALALVPYENNDDLIKIKERNSELIDDTFNVYTVKTFDEVLEYCLL